MVSVKDVADVIKMLGDVVKSTREVIEQLMTVENILR
jgi:hypothetical protein